MLRRYLTIISLLGLLLSVGLWGVSYLNLALVTSNVNCGLTCGAFVLTPNPEDILVVVYYPTGADTFSYDEDDNGNRTFVYIYIGGTRNPNEKARLQFDLTDGKEWVYAGYGNLRTWWIPHLKHAPTWLILPLWMPTLLFSVAFTALCMTFHRRRRRRRRGLCVDCGYDLRGSTDRCPECGYSR